jgi:filamentous hemagglutinin family protein
MSPRHSASIRPSLRGLLLAAVGLPLIACAGLAQALPTGGVVTGTSGGNVIISGFGTTLGVTSQAHRALIDWTSFNVATGETVNFNVPDKNAIIVNRQMYNGPSDINGTITSTYPGASPNQPRLTGGNIWIINPNGVVFGPNAVVNVGGLLATTANLSDYKAFLSAADTDPISFEGGPAGAAVTIDTGAHITVYDGAALFIADMVSANGTVTGAGTFSKGTQVLYGGAQAYTIQFSAAPPDPLRATDLGLFDFTIDEGGSGVSSSGITKAGQVILDAAGDPLDSGHLASIEVQTGTLTATGVRGDGNDLMIISDNIVGGAAAGDPYAWRTVTSIGSEPPPPGLSEAKLVSAGGLVISGGEAVFLGSLFRLPTLKLNIAGESQISGDHVYIANVGGSITPDVSTGPNLDDLDGGLTSVVVVGNHHTITLGTVTTLGTMDIEGLDGATTGALTGGSGVTVLSGGPTNLGDVAAANGAVSIASTDNLTVANLAGQSVTASAGGPVTFVAIETSAPGTADAKLKVVGATSATAGDVNLTATGPVLLDGAVTATGAANITAGREMTVAAVTAGGPETLLGGADITTGLLTTPSTVDVEATGNLKLGGAFAGSLRATAGQTLTVIDAVNVQTGAVFQATGLFHNEAPIAVLAANTPARGSGVPLTTVLEVDSTSVDIGAPISITDASGGTAAIVLNSLNPNGVAIGGGLSGTSGFYDPSGAEVSKLSADGVLVLASDASNLEVGNLSIDAARTPVFQVGIGPSAPAGGTSEAEASDAAASVITVSGVVTGTGAPTFEAGGSAIGVGGGMETVSYTPDRVIVSGAIGTGGSPFGEVDLTANTDVLIGSATFVQAFDAASDPTTLPSDVYQAGYGGVAPGHVFIDAGVVQLGASRAIAQQTTAPNGGGLRVTKTLAINDMPVRVDLFGYVPNADGVLVNGPAAALSPNILINGTPPETHTYLFNGCRIGDPTDCVTPPPTPPTPTTTINSNTRPPTPQEFPPVQTLSIYPWDTGDLIVLPSAQAQTTDPTKSGLQTVSGIANEDVWPTDSNGRCPPMRTKGSGAPPQANQACPDQ